MVERDQRAKNLAFSLYNFLSYASGAAASAFLYLTETQNFRLIFMTVLGLAIVQVAIYSVLKFPVLNRADPRGKAKPETRRRIRTMSSLFFARLSSVIEINVESRDTNCNQKHQRNIQWIIAQVGEKKRYQKEENVAYNM